LERERYERLRAAMADGLYDRRMAAAASSRAVGGASAAAAAGAGYDRMDRYGVGDRYADAYPREYLGAGAVGSGSARSALAAADYYSRSAYPSAAAMSSSAARYSHAWISWIHSR
jgi:hypothetical protein